MHWIRNAIASSLCVFLSFPSVSVASGDEKHVVGSADLSRMMQERVDRDRAQRELIQRVLERREVRDVAQRFGLDLLRAKDAVPTLSGRDLEEVAARADDVERTLAGGDSIILTTTTIIIIALLVTVVVLATD